MRFTTEEKAFLTKNYGKMLTADIAQHLQRPVKLIRHKAWRMGLKGNNKLPRSLQPIQTMQDMGFVLCSEFTGTNKSIDVLCPFCKSTFRTTPQRIISKHTKSCGCVALGKRSGGKYISGDFWGRLIRSAKQRSIDIQLSIDEIEATEKEVDALINEAVEFALSSPYPDPESVMENIYA